MDAFKNILIVESDKALRESLVEQFSTIKNLHVSDTSDAREALDHLEGTHFTLLIIAINLPESDCVDICQFVKSNNLGCSIILMIDSGSIIQNSIFEDLGVEVYLKKQFRFSSLLRLIMLQIQKHERRHPSKMTVGKFVFHPSEKTLLEVESKNTIRLTEKEVAILQYLFAANEKTVERDVLLNEVWGYNSGISTHTLETHIYRLRQKVEPNPSKPQFLITEEGGYLLTN